MPRPLQRARLESGLNLNLYRLVRQGFVRPGCQLGPRSIRWSNSYTGEEIASGEITSDLSSTQEGWFRIRMGMLNQWITLVPHSRHFGGRQWYFVCPCMKRPASVLWMPPGARDFACRQKWGRQVAYGSQFLDRDNRAHHGKAKINSRLCSIDGLDPYDWDFPPKPKWMRWRTYHRAEEKFDRYESNLDEGTLVLVARLLGRG